MDIKTLEDEETRLILPRFTEEEALTLGLALVDLARADALPLVIDIRTADRTLFHAAMPGAAPLNDLWARRKSNTALLCHKSSLRVGVENRAKGREVQDSGMNPADFADHGGAFPIRVADVGVVAVVTVSGLPQAEDHALVVQALGSLL